MKPIYLVRRHRLAPKHYQGLARKRAVYNRDYEVIHITSDVADANAKKLACEMQTRMAKKPEPYKYTILRKTVGRNHTHSKYEQNCSDCKCN